MKLEEPVPRMVLEVRQAVMKSLAEKLSNPSGRELETLGGTEDPVNYLQQHRLGFRCATGPRPFRCWWMLVPGWDTGKKNPIP